VSVFQRLLFMCLDVMSLFHRSGDVASRVGSASRGGAASDERGQTTAEYALVIIAAAAIAGLLLAWATKTHAITNLLDRVIELIIPG